MLKYYALCIVQMFWQYWANIVQILFVMHGSCWQFMHFLVTFTSSLSLSLCTFDMSWYSNGASSTWDELNNSESFVVEMLRTNCTHNTSKASANSTKCLFAYQTFTTLITSSNSISLVFTFLSIATFTASTWYF